MFKELLAEIPSGAWAIFGAFVGAAGGLVAGWINNRSATERLREQLKHDATQRERDRQMALKKEVYLAAAEAVSGLQALLGRLLDPGLPNEEISSESSKHLATLGKVYVVGSDQTVRAVSGF